MHYTTSAIVLAFSGNKKTTAETFCTKATLAIVTDSGARGPLARPRWPRRPKPPGRAGQPCPQSPMARRPGVLVGGAGRTGSRGKGSAAHPEVARRASRGGGCRRAAYRVTVSSGTCRETVVPAAIRVTRGRFFWVEGRGRRGGARGVLGCSREGRRWRG
jgi:hypothetical protein